MKKAISMLLVMGLSAGLLAGCGAKSVSGSEEATAENPMVLTLSHGLSETHTVHIAMEEFAEKVEERTDGRIKVEIFPNAQLGSETESMEQLTAEEKYGWRFGPVHGNSQHGVRLLHPNRQCADDEI